MYKYYKVSVNYALCTRKHSHFCIGSVVYCLGRGFVIITALQTQCVRMDSAPGGRGRCVKRES